MIPVSTLYDEYIDRPKLTEQKKTPAEYIVPPPPLKRGRNNKLEANTSNKKCHVISVIENNCGAELVVNLKHCYPYFCFIFEFLNNLVPN